MKSLLKYLTIFCAIAALLALAALVALRSLYPPEKLKTLAVEKLESALGREVRIASASIGLGTLDLKNVEISEARDFKAGTFFKADAFTVRLRLAPLLRRKIELAQLRLSGWEIKVVKTQNGALNVSTLGQAGEASGKPAAPAANSRSGSNAGASALALTVSSLILRDGKILYMDKTSGADMVLESVQAQWNGLRLDGPSDLALGFDYSYSAQAGAKPVPGHLDFRGEVDPARMDMSRMSLEVKKLQAEYAGLKVTAQGKVRDFSSPKVDLNFNLPALTPEKLKSLAALPAGLRLPAFQGGLRLEQTGQTIRLEELKLEDAKGKQTVVIEGNMFLPRAKAAPMALDFRVKSDLLNLHEIAGWLAEAPARDVTGAGSLDLRLTGTSASPILAGQAQFNSLGLAESGQTLSAASASAKFTPGKVNAAMKGKLNGSDFNLILTAKPSSGPMDAAGSFVIESIRHPNFSAGKTELTWDLSGLAQDLSHLNGSCKFRVGAGKFDNLRTLSEASPMAKLVLLPIMALQSAAALVKIPLFPAFDRVNFSEITGEYAFKNGVMNVRESHLNSSVAYAAMTGTADLRSEKLALHISTKLGSEIGLKISGPIGFLVSGTLSEPKVRLDPASILKQPGIEKVLGPDMDKAVEQGRKLLENIFK